MLRHLARVPAPLGVAAGTAVVALLAATLHRCARAVRQLWLADATCRRLGPDIGGLSSSTTSGPQPERCRGCAGEPVRTRALLSRALRPQRTLTAAPLVATLAVAGAALVAERVTEHAFERAAIITPTTPGSR